MKSLPARPSSDFEFDAAVYVVALDGVTQWALREAIRSVLQGGLGHTFFPAAPELRMHCEKVYAPVLDRLDREARERRAREEAAEFRPVEPKTPEQKARASAAYAAFVESHERIATPGRKSEAEELKEIRAKYDPELLDAIPDRPQHNSFDQIGGKFKR